MRTHLAELLDDRRGVAAPTTALGLIVVLGFAGLGVDVGHGYLQRRTAQHAADSAAFSGAAALTSGAADPAAEARALAVRYGFEPTRVTVNLPPQSGPNTGAIGAVEVLVERPGRRFFSALLGGGANAIKARAVAKVGRAADGCVVALNATASASAYETGSADVVLEDCSLYANSTSASALELKGGAQLTAKSVELVGGYDKSSNSSITAAEGIHTNQAPVEDPYKDVEIPDYDETCDPKPAGTGTYGRTDGRPTVYCNGLTINSRDVVTLRPGVHIIDRGSLLVNGGATLQGDGVTIILTSTTGGNYATLDVRGGATLTLTAPIDGPTAGLSFFQDRRAPGTGVHLLNGGSTQSIQGAIYFPSQTVRYTGGATSSGGCTQILASKVEFYGSSRVGVNCAGTGVKPIGGRRPTLVE